ncbi:MAG: NADH:ubiquinone reductase (Na(+)-transporting) subunit C [Prevotellaceae bacterium]|nr:NADH:ubiquinone reductase (Na(+)-transporting) subunit C [Prevotellaceae bacterium]
MENNSDIKNKQDSNVKHKKIDINGSAYTVIYSVIMVVVVAVLLTVASTALKPAQKLNQEIEKKENILKTVGKTADIANVKNKAEYIKNEYGKYIRAAATDINGNFLDVSDSIVFTLELKRELAKPEAERQLPVFICKDGEQLRYIFQLHGRGLWGSIWGYIAFESDMHTIAGVVFDHEGETPGLGAEITTEIFQKQFENKKIDEDNSLPIIIQKPGGELNSHTVDGISGGTITSKGVQQMLADNLKLYKGFITKIKSQNNNNNIETNDKNQEL